MACNYTYIPSLTSAWQHATRPSILPASPCLGLQSEGTCNSIPMLTSGHASRADVVSNACDTSGAMPAPKAKSKKDVSKQLPVCKFSSMMGLYHSQILFCLRKLLDAMRRHMEVATIKKNGEFVAGRLAKITSTLSFLA